MYLWWAQKHSRSFWVWLCALLPRVVEWVICSYLGSDLVNGTFTNYYKVFSFISQEERQRSIWVSLLSDSMNNVAFMVKNNKGPKNFGGPQGLRKERPYCTKCKINGHTIDTCYKSMDILQVFAIITPICSSNSIRCGESSFWHSSTMLTVHTPYLACLMFYLTWLVNSLTCSTFNRPSPKTFPTFHKALSFLGSTIVSIGATAWFSEVLCG